MVVETTEKKNKTALRNDLKDNKTPLQLIPPIAEEEIAKVLAFGTNKYPPWNWMIGLPYMRTIGSCKRHINAWIRGEDNDPESGLSHLSHAICNLIFILEWEKTNKKIFDDRPKKFYQKDKT